MTDRARIVFLSHTHRGSVIKVGSYHLAREFARRGHEVLFVSTPTSPFHMMRARLRPTHIASAELPDRLALRMGRVDRAPGSDHGGRIVDYVPFTVAPCIRLPLLDSVFAAKHGLSFAVPPVRSVLADHGFLEADLVLIDEPTLGFMREHLAAKRWLYRITDLYADLPDAKKSIVSLEDHIAGFVDGFIAASQPIADMVLRRWGERAEVLENGVAFDRFHTTQDEPEEYRALQRPRAVYVGSLDKRFSWDSLALAAAGNPEMQFVLIGPSSGHPPLPPNVTCIGPVSYERLPAFLQHADVGLLPLEQGASNPGRSPMKLYEYAACGLPVVATATAELARRDHAFVFLANSAKEFPGQTRAAIAARHDVRRAAIDQARARSWENIADRILEEFAGDQVPHERGA